MLDATTTGRTRRTEAWRLRLQRTYNGRETVPNASLRTQPVLEGQWTILSRRFYACLMTSFSWSQLDSHGEVEAILVVQVFGRLRLRSALHQKQHVSQMYVCRRSDVLCWKIYVVDREVRPCTTAHPDRILIAYCSQPHGRHNASIPVGMHWTSLTSNAISYAHSCVRSRRRTRQ